MKKLLYGSMLSIVLASVYLLPEDSNEMSFDNLAKVKDMMDDSIDTKEIDAPKSSESFGSVVSMPKSEVSSLAPVMHKNESVDMPEMGIDHEVTKLHEASKVAKTMPELTAQDIKDDIKMHVDIFKKHEALSKTLGNLVWQLGGRLDHRPQPYAAQFNNEDTLSEAEHNLIKNIKKVESLSRQAAEAHSKVSKIYGSLQELEKDGFEPGDKLQDMAAELSKKATDLSAQADKEMVSLLGIRLMINL
ncbi:hypothetical protein HYV10_02720 [Candidatus Dependentiae bacterium]|nr:hypothetical protein [Candidatus Dependentiae bacterium]